MLVVGIALACLNAQAGERPPDAEPLPPLSELDPVTQSGRDFYGLHSPGESAPDAVNEACELGMDLTPWLEQFNSLLGDADFDGKVQFNDFMILAQHFSQPGLYTEGDFDCTGVVQFPDFVILAGNFGESGSGTAALVPEPGGIILVAWSLFGLVMVGRRLGGSQAC